MAPRKPKKQETFQVTGENLVNKVKDVVKAGNVRKIIIKDKSGSEIATFPLTVGVAGAILAPPLAAIGAIVALVSECSIVVVRNKQ